jgi:type IV pilus assembly protein PilA
MDQQQTGRAAGRTRESGFSLIELLIVVAIILIIAAIAIPNLLRATIAANESSAANSVRKVATAEYAYYAAYPTVGYSPDLPSLGGPASNCSPSSTTACIIDSILSGSSKSGYTFFAKGFADAGGSGINTTFVSSSAPQSFNITGVRNFCVVTDGVLRMNPGASGMVPAADVAACVSYAISQ